MNFLIWIILYTKSNKKINIKIINYVSYICIQLSYLAKIIMKLWNELNNLDIPEELLIFEVCIINLYSSVKNNSKNKYRQFEQR